MYCCAASDIDIDTFRTLNAEMQCPLGYSYIDFLPKPLFSLTVLHKLPDTQRSNILFVHGYGWEPAASREQFFRLCITK
jgi:hypothetical protein